MSTKLHPDTLLSKLKTHKDLIDAIEKGKTIQMHVVFQGWKDLAVTELESPAFFYRVKPEPEVIKIVKDVWAAPSTHSNVPTIKTLGFYLEEEFKSYVKHYKMELTLTEIIED